MENKSHCIISLTNQKGKIKAMMGAILVKGVNNIVIDKVASLESGEYQLQVKNGNNKILYNSDLIKK